MELKPGIKTSEGWGTIVATVVSLLVMAGVLKPEDSSLITDLATQAVGGIVALGVLATYILARVDLKKKALEVSRDIELKQVSTPEVQVVELG